jgi:hypothetical protein
LRNTHPASLVHAANFFVPQRKKIGPALRTRRVPAMVRNAGLAVIMGLLYESEQKPWPAFADRPKAASIV